MRTPAFQFYPKQWLGDDMVLLMNFTARGMHMHLMCIAWQQDPIGSLPDDDELLEAWCGHPPDWPSLKKQIFRAWENVDGRWYQGGLLKEVAKQAAWRNKSQAGGRRSAESRKTNQTNPEPIGNHPSKNTNHPSFESNQASTKTQPNVNSSSSSSSTEKKEQQSRLSGNGTSGTNVRSIADRPYAVSKSADAIANLDDWNKPDIHELARNLSRELHANHPTHTDVGKAEVALQARLLNSKDPPVECDSIRTSHQEIVPVWNAKLDRNPDAYVPHLWQFISGEMDKQKVQPRTTGANALDYYEVPEL